MTFWTEDRVQILLEMWRQGVSSRKIAETLGNGVTRNAVIGKVNRLKKQKRVTLLQEIDSSKVVGGNSYASVSDFGAKVLPEDMVGRGHKNNRNQHSIKSKGQGVGSLGHIQKDDSVKIIKMGQYSKIKDGLVKGVAFSDLGADMCRWPLSGEGSGEERGKFFFCGLEAEASGSKYCDYHYQLAYSKTKK